MSTGRSDGRFVYTRVDVGTPGAGEHYVYTVNRAGGGQYLGQVRRKTGTSWWTADNAEGASAGAKHRRRVWAADQLDAQSLADAWCACGVAVGAHDRPTRAAMRAWARWDDSSDVPRKAATWSVAWAARPRGRHYDLNSCVEHARQFANPVGEGACLLVRPDVAPWHTVWVRRDPQFGNVVVTHTVGGQTGESYDWPDLAADTEQVRDVYLGREYRVTHDWGE